jgi:hypothetical protein
MLEHPCILYAARYEVGTISRKFFPLLIMEEMKIPSLDDKDKALLQTPDQGDPFRDMELFASGQFVKGAQKGFRYRVGQQDCGAFEEPQ